MYHGYFRLFRIGRVSDWTPLSNPVRNSLSDTWAAILVRTAFLKDLTGCVNAMFIEFANPASPGAVAVPTFDPTAGAGYYAGLVNSPTNDYLRVPLLFPPETQIAPGYEASIPVGQANYVRCRAIATGTTGVHGKSFLESANSRVIGLGLASVPDWNDPSQDLLFASGYYAGDAQVPKNEAGDDIGVSYYWSPVVVS